MTSSHPEPLSPETLDLETLNLEMLASELLDQHCALSLSELAQAIGQDEQWVILLVQADILPVQAPEPAQWRFVGEHISRARRAYRLQRDFEASLPAVAMMLDMLDELHQLRQQVRYLQTSSSWIEAG